MLSPKAVAGIKQEFRFIAIKIIMNDLLHVLMGFYLTCCKAINNTNTFSKKLVEDDSLHVY